MHPMSDHSWLPPLAIWHVCLITTLCHHVSPSRAPFTPFCLACLPTEWMAPEVLRCEDVNEAADVYSYGVCLW